MQITTSQKGNFNHTIKFLEISQKVTSNINLDNYGQRGVDALVAATPIESGLTASSWYYRVIRDNKKVSLNFYNSNVQNGVPIAIVIQYGHATRNGGWVEGQDYINPAIQPIFDEISEAIRMEVSS